MEITPVVPAGQRQLIESYRTGGFKIAGVRYQGSVLVLPEQALLWPVQELAEITIASFEPITRAEPAVEILLLGCGSKSALPPAPLRDELRERGLVMEAMATAAACRTYNVLLAEDRRVAAALIAL